ncbi:hypothetical protein OIU84_011146 [Salix udensis]|uniref:Transmembrane protein n=1 Tax=Salix udensis TaxID=889485 RepID=A0AAD6NWC8_9ROSI|nr:hypothetical protein OIU84_011146 [Salix udensis]
MRNGSGQVLHPKQPRLRNKKEKLPAKQMILYHEVVAVAMVVMMVIMMVMVGSGSSGRTAKSVFFVREIVVIIREVRGSVCGDGHQPVA